ncbi:hypothetical protein DCS_08070 [Drechmeria coniospora]|uniref:Peptidase M10 metallopeptidase domain-containing protein n=1 Tax=Drechmeria coniospora TaxID=98403 RepID=A0A151GG92_DRECN|nr:hypothetical protein DCS_08070 [Drechmeria coniospora]KYK56104.1 hypothetical protein DCS_08070 [Drechmeria coniospora]
MRIPLLLQSGLLAATATACATGEQHEPGTHQHQSRDLQPDPEDHGQMVTLSVAAHLCCSNNAKCADMESMEKLLGKTSQRFAIANITFSLEYFNQFNDARCKELSGVDDERRNAILESVHKGGPSTINLLYVQKNEANGIKGMAKVPNLSGNSIEDQTSDRYTGESQDGATIAMGSIPGKHSGWGANAMVSCHEFGHLFGLEHDNLDKSNVMTPYLENDKVTFKKSQVPEMRRIAFKRLREGGFFSAEKNGTITPSLTTPPSGAPGPKPAAEPDSPAAESYSPAAEPYSPASEPESPAAEPDSPAESDYPIPTGSRASPQRLPHDPSRPSFKYSNGRNHTNATYPTIPVSPSGPEGLDSETPESGTTGEYDSETTSKYDTETTRKFDSGSTREYISGSTGNRKSGTAGNYNTGTTGGQDSGTTGSQYSGTTGSQKSGGTYKSSVSPINPGVEVMPDESGDGECECTCPDHPPVGKSQSVPSSQNKASPQDSETPGTTSSGTQSPSGTGNQEAGSPYSSGSKQDLSGPNPNLSGSTPDLSKTRVPGPRRKKGCSKGRKSRNRGQKNSPGRLPINPTLSPTFNSTTNSTYLTNSTTDESIPIESSTGEKVPTESILYDEIPTGSSTGEKLPTESILYDEIPTGSSTGEKLPTESILYDEIPTGSSTGEKLPTESILYDEIPTGSSTGEMPMESNTDETVPTKPSKDEKIPMDYRR